jgi:hypothetical protein
LCRIWRCELCCCSTELAYSCETAVLTSEFYSVIQTYIWIWDVTRNTHWTQYVYDNRRKLSVFQRQLKNLKTYNIQVVHKNKLLNGSNNYLFIQKIIEVENQLNESKLYLLFLYMLVFLKLHCTIFSLILLWYKPS